MLEKNTHEVGENRTHDTSIVSYTALLLACVVSSIPADFVLVVFESARRETL